MLLTEFKYKRYMNKANSATDIQQVRDCLYTFLSYYRTLGKEPSLTKSGVDYLRIVDAFQEIIHKYYLQRPLSNLPLKTLEPACQASTKAIAMWFYAERNNIRIQTINVKHIRKVKKAMARVQSLLNRVKKNKDLCLGLHISNTSVTLITVPHDKIVPLKTSKHTKGDK